MNLKMKRFCEHKLKDQSYYTEIKLKDITEPITILLGPNGTGKSMSLKLIEQELKKQKKDYISYTTSRNDIVAKTSTPWGDWDPYKLACAFHSEGERMTDSFFEWVNSEFLGAVLSKDDPLYVLIDEADSGLSFDRLKETLPQLTSIVKMEVDKGRNIKVIFTCNSYEMYECTKLPPITDTIWVPTKEHIDFQSYEEFKSWYIPYYELVLKKWMEED